MAPEDPASKPVSDDQEALAPHAPMDPDEAIAADSDVSFTTYHVAGLLILKSWLGFGWCRRLFQRDRRGFGNR